MFEKRIGTSGIHREDGKVVETCVQGSMGMSTVVQNEDHDYDIDVAIVFNKSDLGDKGAQATRNMVANALRRKTKQFNTEPEIKTSCVRVKYGNHYIECYVVKDGVCVAKTRIDVPIGRG